MEQPGHLHKLGSANVGLDEYLDIHNQLFKMIFGVIERLVPIQRVQGKVVEGVH